jgi:hypothetical protein
MTSIIKVDTVQDVDGNNIISENANTITIGASGDTISIPAGATLVNSGTATGFGLSWQSVQTTGFTAVKGNAYPCNTTSAAFTVTLPATPALGDQVLLVDYAGTFDTNALTINPNGNKIESGTVVLQLKGEREGVTLTYIDSTQGWIASSGINEGTDALEPIIYSVDFLVVAGGGGGGRSNGGGGGAGGFRTSTQSVGQGTVITVTVGDGGAGSITPPASGTNGSNSSISGSGLTTITSTGGGSGSTSGSSAGSNGGSGGGGTNGLVGGSGNTPSTSPSQGNNGGDGTAGGGGPYFGAAGGGGAGAVGGNSSTTVGGNGGNGTANSITGSSVTRGGGGGGGVSPGGTTGTGGTGGGGNGGDNSTGGTNGTANTGSGGGGSGNLVGASGGKGVVILSVPDANYSSTTTGSPTVTPNANGTGKTVIQFNGDGSYTA